MPLLDIVVGLDGSESSVDALRWASGFADRDDAATVRILSTWRIPTLATLPSIVTAVPSPAAMDAHVTEQIDQACIDAAGPKLPRKIVEGDAGAALVAESDNADLVVVGRTGSGHRGVAKLLTDLVLGSTTRFCLHHAKGPVAVVPPSRTWVANPAVVVGVDGSASSIAALQWVIDTLPSAASITVVQAVPPYLEGLLAVDRGIIDKTIAATSAELDEILSHVGADQSSTEITTEVVVENARHALTRRALAADLLVVGSRSRSAALTPLLGSTSDHVVRHASCPVVVVPPTKGHP